jgi:holo-[acyl-carrier protein] synthase
MIVGVGTDVVECERIREAIARHGDKFIQRIFTDAEHRYCSQMHDPVPHYAARFAAKEAARKAMARERAMGWHDVEVLRDPEGPIELQFRGMAAVGAKYLKVRRAFVTMAHERGVAVATVILESD